MHSSCCQHTVLVSKLKHLKPCSIKQSKSFTRNPGILTVPWSTHSPWFFFNLYFSFYSFCYNQFFNFIFLLLALSYFLLLVKICFIEAASLSLAIFLFFLLFSLFYYKYHTHTLNFLHMWKTNNGSPRNTGISLIFNACLPLFS